MALTATNLGKEYGLTGEEMNLALKKLGFLIGDPGDYDFTVLGRQYGHTECHHRGPGGYSMYNRDWGVHKYDESIKDVLDISNDLKEEVRTEIAEKRAARYAAIVEARKKADAEFLAKEAAKKASEMAEQKRQIAEIERIAKLKKYGKICLIIGGSVIVGYSTYRLIKHVKQKRGALSDKIDQADSSHIVNENTDTSTPNL